MSKVWSKEDINKIVAICKACYSIEQAVSIIQPIYGKSRDSIEKALERAGRKSIFQYVQEYKPTDKQINDFIGGYKPTNEQIVNYLKENNPEYILKEEKEIKKMKQEAHDLRKLLEHSESKNQTSEELKNLIHELNNTEFDKTPSWVLKPSSKTKMGIPVLQISDVHYDEVVFKDQVNGLNAYNHVIANKRLNHTFYQATNLLLNHFKEPVYDGLVLILNGDLLSGNIHEELRENNDQPIFKSLVSLEEILVKNIKALADNFKKIFVVGQVGNHGRMDKKPRCKNAVYDNYEWLLLHHIAKQFADDDRVTVNVPDSFETIYEIYNRRFLQMHGDAIQYQGGVGGILVPIMRHWNKRQEKWSAVGKPFDVLILGHFHQKIMLDNIIVNSCVKGFDEFSLKMGFKYERPTQNLWIEHPTNGMTFASPVFCDGYQGGYPDKLVKEGVRVI